MGGTAPANQLRLSFAGSEDGAAETETCRAAKPLWRTTTRTPRPVRAQLTEPPYADPHVRWCGRGERATAPPMPIAEVRRQSGSPSACFGRPGTPWPCHSGWPGYAATERPQTFPFRSRSEEGRVGKEGRSRWAPDH